MRRLCASAAALTVVGLGSQASALEPRAVLRSSGAIRFGVIADVQYADADDGTNYGRTVVRHYRGALAQLTRAVAHWNAQPEPLAFVVNLGDVIDGLCAKLGQSERALDDVLRQFGKVASPVVHLKGNHELYNYPDPAELGARLGGLGGSPEHCAFSVGAPPAGLRVLVLDAYKIALMSPTKEVREQALRMLAEHNPNDVEGEGNWAVGLPAGKGHFVPYNGALGQAQLQWLGAELCAAASRGERVLVLSHAPLHPQACGGSTMPWDHEEALRILRTEGGGGVVAVLAGHDHNGGYAHEGEAGGSGIHYLTLQSPLNKGDAGESYGVLELDCEALTLTVSGPRLADFLPPKLLAPGADAPTLRLALRPLRRAPGAEGAATCPPVGGG